ncbi:MAG: hypothetical protein ABIF85_00120 [Nanoarchaeota archaeon]|nr:hypothetical protein [Nanoarchaeota archaeon]MBU4300051.1 hypothetical protein [Nanoarchaeota archaeon]MBU4451852.1 hypothetical protein [Nanoarchaeota archaeon]MCG2724412.1 hypothetical protein [archaeon]
MALFDGFFKSRKEKKIASEIVHNCYAEVAKELGITNYKPPKIRLDDLANDELGAYNRDKNRIILRKDQVGLYVKCLDNEAYLKKMPEDIRAPEKYEAAVKKVKSVMDETYKSIKGTTVHEIIHDFEKADASKEPVLRRGQEGIADFATLLLTNETKEEVVNLIHQYRDNGPPKSRNHLKKTGVYEYLKEVEKRKTGKTDLFGKMNALFTAVLIPDNEKRIAKLKDTVKNEETGSYESLWGYRLGALAALSAYDLSKKEKISKINELLKDPDSHNRLNELETLAEKGIEIYKNEMRKNKPSTNVEMKSNIQEVEDNLEKMVNTIYEPVNKREKKSAQVAVVSAILLIAFLIFEINKETTSVSVGLVTQTMATNPYTIVSIIFLAAFFLFLRKNKLN